MSTNHEINLETLYPKPYCVVNNCLSVRKGENGEKGTTQLANFAPYIKKQIIHDDGYELKSKALISGVTKNGDVLPEIEVKSDEFANLGWITNCWGFSCNIASGSCVRDQIRFALQSTAENAEIITKYSVTGWKKINGTWQYLMPGNDNVTVELPKKMEGYQLNSQYSETDIRNGYALLVSDIASRNILYPLLAFVFMSPLNHFLREAHCEPKLVLMLLGKTGSKKSTLVALMLSFFGVFTSSTLPLSFKDTALSIIQNTFTLKDVLTCIDDYHPSSRHDEGVMTDTAQKILRSYGDRVGRGRLNSHSDQMPTKYPQGNAIITAEFAPEVGESGNARYFTVEMGTESINTDELSRFQSIASTGSFSAFMYAYIEWLKASFLSDSKKESEWIQSLNNEFTTTRTKFSEKLKEQQHHNHARLPENIAVMHIGFKYFTMFLVAAGVLKEQDCEYLMLIFDEVIYNLGVKQNNIITADKPTHKFIAKICSMLDSEQWKSVSRINPPDPLPFSFICYEDDENYYFPMTTAHKMVKKLCDEQGESFTISERSLSKALKEERLIVTGHNQNSKSVRIGDEFKHLFVISKETANKIYLDYLGVTNEAES